MKKYVNITIRDFKEIATGTCMIVKREHDDFSVEIESSVIYYGLISNIPDKYDKERIYVVHAVSLEIFEIWIIDKWFW